MQLLAEMAPAAAVVLPAEHLVHPGAGLSRVPAADQVPREQMAHDALRPKPAAQIGTVA